MAVQEMSNGQDSTIKADNTGSTLLRRTLQANEIFSAVSGLMFLFFSKQVAEFLGTPNSRVILFLGIGLLLWAGFTAWVSMQSQLNPTMVKLIIEGDLLWVVGSILLLIFAGGLFSTSGKWAIAIVGDIVALFAILQWVGLRRLGRA